MCFGYAEIMSSVCLIQNGCIEHPMLSLNCRPQHFKLHDKRTLECWILCVDDDRTLFSINWPSNIKCTSLLSSRHPFASVFAVAYLSVTALPASWVFTLLTFLFLSSTLRWSTCVSHSERGSNSRQLGLRIRKEFYFSFFFLCVWVCVWRGGGLQKVEAETCTREKKEAC